LALNADILKPVVPFQPTTTRTFSATDTLRVFGRAFWRDKGEAVVKISIKNVPGTLIEPALTKSPGVKGGQQVVFDADVPLARLTPGSHLLVVTAELKDGKVVTREVPFSVK
jgi:hypothetical protein